MDELGESVKGMLDSVYELKKEAHLDRDTIYTLDMVSSAGIVYLYLINKEKEEKLSPEETVMLLKAMGVFFKFIGIF